MKSKNIRMIAAILLICCIIFVPFNTVVYAENSSFYTYDSIYSDFIPNEANEYVKNNYSYILNVVKDNLFLFNLQEMDVTNIEIGKPYIIYNINDDYSDEIYYYPVINKSKNEIILIINLIGTTDGWSMSIDQNLVNNLNEINFLEGNYIIYANDEGMIAENNTECVIIEGKKNSEIKDYEKITYSQKISNIQNSLKQRSKINVKTINGGVEEGINASRDYSVNTSTHKVCTLFNSKGQGYLPICWAASVATIVNYVNGSNISAIDVCSTMGTGYTAQNITMKNNALRYYGIDFYEIIYEQLSWSDIKTNINNRFPIAASLFSEDNSGHAVTVMGYREIDGVRNPRYYITIWNSGINENQGGAQVLCYTYSGTSLTYDNKAYVWKYSLY